MTGQDWQVGWQITCLGVREVLVREATRTHVEISKDHGATWVTEPKADVVGSEQVALDTWRRRATSIHTKRTAGDLS